MPPEEEMESAFDASGRLLAQERSGDNAPALSVSELSALLKRTVEDRFGHVRLRGEISGYKRAASGHVYLCLKDDNALIDGVMWKGAAARLAFAPQDGIEVIATGKLTTYPGRSKYQIVIERMELAGEGALMQLFEQLKRQLAAEGLFAPERKKRLPYLPRVIGVVTSPTGAVIRDILHRLEDRCPTQVLVWPVLVQGEGAAAQVAAAVRGFSAMAPGGAVPRPDLVIVARGGGSIEDLWAFNEEAVVRAVADCTIPVISAVGHETDTTLCDYAADVRAPTPTAAAEMAVPVRAELMAGLNELGLRSNRAVRRGVELRRERLALTARLLPAPETLLATQRQRADDLGERLTRGLRQRVTLAWRHLSEAGGALRPAVLHQRVARERARLDAVRLRPDLVTRGIAQRRERLDASWRLALSLDPRRPLSKGFALVSAGEQVLTSASAARAAGAMRLTFHDGALDVIAQEGVESAALTRLSQPQKPARKNPRTESAATTQQDLFGAARKDDF
ncbi:exodeoxyribonuclease VII large subunit [Sphingobium sp. DEHP117]|uniref:exodeoxyribonuclease VII large subunit n=1 Tax=Sphingobium sp. DEHP117 TaxID=2993436 RepID=UPI0027D5F3F3|nr:exodeoxyribonuclease VII large subunit [Sphingobium sp. DEHP117]MDQ4420517.1 exodeoxyribonuclease VII large subunit [Sphingobium sp. DEHP117]